MWIVSYVAIVMCGFGFGAAVVFVYHAIIKPAGCNFTVGTCLTTQRKKERWDLPSDIYKIVEIGKDRYRVAKWGSETGKWLEKLNGYYFTVHKETAVVYYERCADPSLNNEKVK